MYALKPAVGDVTSWRDKGDYYKKSKGNGMRKRAHGVKVVVDFLSYLLNECQLSKDDGDLIQKMLKRQLLEEKKKNWLKASNCGEGSYLQRVDFEKKWDKDEIRGSQMIVKVKELMRKHMEQYLESKKRDLEFQNEFLNEELSLLDICKRIKQDLKVVRVYKGDVKVSLGIIDELNRELEDLCEQAIAQINDYMKYAILPKLDVEQLNLENQESMLRVFNQNCNQLVAKSNQLAQQCNLNELQAKLDFDVKELQLELEELQSFEKQLEYNEDLKQLLLQNKEMRILLNKNS